MVRGNLDIPGVIRNIQSTIKKMTAEQKIISIDCEFYSDRNGRILSLAQVSFFSLIKSKSEGSKQFTVQWNVKPPSNAFSVPPRIHDKELSLEDVVKEANAFLDSKSQYKTIVFGGANDKIHLGRRFDIDVQDVLEEQTGVKMTLHNA
jgi:hypothetical protein